LFQPFSQADTSIARRYGGTGLGLALVRRFCQLMGGEVAVESATGGGTRFIVHLPATVIDRPERGLRPLPVRSMLPSQHVEEFVAG